MPALTTRDLCFAYDGVDVLHDVSVELLPGEVVAIAGPNGSGKSTLIELLAGVRRPRRGEIQRRGDLALVVQRPAAPAELPVSAADVVAMGTWKRGARMPRSAARAAVAEALDRVGMREVASRPLLALSGGQRQRVFLAQGIVRRPGILLLDEPAAGLDATSVDRMQRILAEEAARGAVVACVSHDGDAIAGADRVVRLEGGIRVA
ncbi:MAG: metal ABC transporter ATP-binding protein [Microbacterium sp.]|uniref:metal ABC transporter ATP-binding protein n=1 Tax=Microbacterium sp. TaxID=51671 RepID=UPI001AD460BE|nr:metal ABC transporter ATP-binding protein [Microbacterium sp.]MBN9177479.1 metal ABC transporter ATP-binding protein [Microbacterium sp.]